MKDKALKVRLSQRRLDKLRLYADYADKTMTQVVEELIDSLPNIKNGDFSPTHCSVNPVD